MPSSGSFLIDPTTGRVEQSTFVVGGDAAGVASTSTVTYERDRTLGLWLPDEMREEYTTPGVERVTGVATYSRYRRADISVRILPNQ